MTLLAQGIDYGSSFLSEAGKNYLVYENIKKMGIEATPLSIIPPALAMLFAKAVTPKNISINKCVDRICKFTNTSNKVLKWAIPAAYIGFSTLLFSRLLPLRSDVIFKQIVILTHYKTTTFAINNIFKNIANCNKKKPTSDTEYLNKTILIHNLTIVSLSLLAFGLANIAARNFLSNIFLINILSSSAGIIPRLIVERTMPVNEASNSL